MKRSIFLACAAGTIAAVACGTSGGTTAPGATRGNGILRVQLTDAPFPFDSVASVDIHVVRIDARVATADSAQAASGAGDDSASVGGWTTIARPDRSYDLLTLRGGTVADIGTDTIPPGDYRGFRLIIDPSRSGVKLKNGMQLTGASTPSVSFPSASRTGIKVNVTTPIRIGADSTSTMLIDFDLENSFVMRGNSITKNGLLFKPVLHATPKASS